MILTPILGWSWPALLPVAVASAAALGYKRLTGTDEKAWLRGALTRKMEALQIVSVPVDEVLADVVGEEVGRDDRLVFEKDDFRLVFRRDARGKFFVDTLGPRGARPSALRREALEFARTLTREFVYNRVLREMEARGIHLVEEHEDAETGDIILEMRHFR